MDEFLSLSEATEKAKEMKRATKNNVVVVKRNEKFVAIEAKPEMIITEELILVVEKSD